ncbi:MAG: hypothetical protein ACLGPL_04790, partial [Acidobacteriota bacterium]
VAERIRKRYADFGFTPTSLSIGVARYRSLAGDVDKDVEDLIHRADMALYHAKNTLGRNRVHLDEESLD